MEKYYQNKSRFKGVYSRDNLPQKMKDGSYIKNLDEYADVGTHWIVLYISKNNNAIHFDSFGVERILKEITKFIGNKNIKTNIFRIQAYDSIMCGYFCIRFIDSMLAGKSLIGHASLLLPYDFFCLRKENIVLSYF